MSRYINEDFLDDEQLVAQTASPASLVTTDKGRWLYSFKMVAASSVAWETPENQQKLWELIDASRRRVTHKLESLRIVDEVKTVEIVCAETRGEPTVPVQAAPDLTIHVSEQLYNRYAHDYQWDDDDDEETVQRDPEKEVLKRLRYFYFDVTFDARFRTADDVLLFYRRFCIPMVNFRMAWYFAVNEEMYEMGRLDDDGHAEGDGVAAIYSSKQSDFVMTSDVRDELLDICRVVFDPEYKWADFLVNSRYNNIDHILAEYYEIDNLKEGISDGTVMFVGHYDHIGPSTDPGVWATKHGHPYCDVLRWFYPDGYSDGANSCPWSPGFYQYKLTIQKDMREFCETTPFSVYLIASDKRGNIVLFLYDKTHEYSDGQIRSLGLESSCEHTYSNCLQAALSCVMPLEEASRKVMDFFVFEDDEDDYDDYDDEDYDFNTDDDEDEYDSNDDDENETGDEEDKR